MSTVLHDEDESNF